jgi:hypothetical protein
MAYETEAEIHTDNVRMMSASGAKPIGDDRDPYPDRFDPQHAGVTAPNGAHSGVEVKP